MQLSRKKKWVLGGGVGAVAVVAAIVIVYFAFIKSDAPPPLTLNSVASTAPVSAADNATATTAAGGLTTTSASSANASVSNLDGTWKITTASQVGYRVTEDLVGGLANNVAVGRTNAVTGTVTVAGTKVTAVDASADLTKLTSDSSRRDGQVQTRILSTSQFPTATFKLASPIDFSTVPAVGAENKGKATGDLTIHGVTKRVTIDVTYQLISATEIRMLGTVPIVWSDYKIPSPTFAGVADVRDNGAMEFLIVATR
ncbi:MAG: YceI family protein [Acidimicrobiales bacterium]